MADTEPPNLNGSKLEKIKVPIAPSSEQRRIVAELDAFQAEVDVLNMEQRRSNETAQEWRQIERGWCVGDEVFRQELLAQAEGRFGINHYAGQRQESSEEKARRIVAEELRRLGWKHGELEKCLKADPEKVRIARRLRGETTVALKWIAGELRMGAWTYLSNNLGRTTSR